MSRHNHTMPTQTSNDCHSLPLNHRMSTQTSSNDCHSRPLNEKKVHASNDCHNLPLHARSAFCSSHSWLYSAWYFAPTMLTLLRVSVCRNTARAQVREPQLEDRKRQGREYDVSNSTVQKSSNTIQSPSWYPVHPP